MSCFSRPVNSISSVNIFARIGGDRQFLVYGITLAVPEPCALILPLPLAEGDLRFHSLDDYTSFFDDLDTLFPDPSSTDQSGDTTPAVPPLPADHREDIGTFKASFVETLAAFDKLGDHLRIPADAREKLGYADFGFAVFELKDGGTRVMHPMAVSFPTRDRKSLYFPTVLVTEDKYRPMAEFDHNLYCQTDRRDPVVDWQKSELPIAARVSPDKAGDLLDPGGFAWKSRLAGQKVNQDTWV